MPLQVKQNLPLFVAKRATISIDGLPEISTISANVMKREDEDHNPGLSTGVIKPPTTLPSQGLNQEIHFVELPQINYDAAKGTIPPPVFNGTAAAAAPAVNAKPQYECTAVLELARLPDEWVAKQGVEIPAIRIISESGERTLGQAVYMFNEKSGRIFIEAKTFF